MFSDPFREYRIILASASPRRRQLMEEAGFVFETGVTGFEEVWPQGLVGREIAEYLAEGKADSWDRPLLPGEIVITADTVVWCHETVLGKPSGREEAAAFLRLLSGCDHEVITGICIRDYRSRRTFSVTTRVSFRHLNEEEILFYVDNYQPFDKAGAYGIQEWIGLRGITAIEGSYYNVVGMPVSDLCRELLDFISKK